MWEQNAVDIAEEDPGWPFSWKQLPLAVLPQFAILRAKREGDGLLAVRALFMTFVNALVLVGVVVLILGDLADRDGSVAAPLAIVGVVGVCSALAQRFLLPGLDCTSDATLASSYRNRFFVRLAMSESIALAAFAIGISLGPWWLYFVGLALSAIGFARLAPTRANLAGDQDQLAAGGCIRSLVRALRPMR